MIGLDSLPTGSRPIFKKREKQEKHNCRTVWLELCSFKKKISSAFRAVTQTDRHTHTDTHTHTHLHTHTHTHTHTYRHPWLDTNTVKTG